MTLGSLAWGQAASLIGVPAALLTAAALGAAAALAMRTLPLPAGGESLDPSRHWVEPEAAMPLEPERGPIAVQIAYQVAPERQPAFRAAIAPLGATRRRDGALAWGVFADTEAPDRVVEWFMLASWAEHMRQHHHVTVADQALQATVTALHEGPEAPRVTHLITL
jgi:quinol monooxygenase YgiN